mmetsp:Transcript_2644/g.5718  ORF Transcript_2644/g.5718 Transcript_2644/m.5718 type:complete len:182 (-) Transcript_2644:107-652(-)|eukprot:CAMPEP_0181168090 /NCGR_PEP_ID=MMETSP1096-20121128/76_1 /TAXON_ID=156174 ORGANISM="Chrysochromulina ericina, Strain CCMP281" /NCGR_SAMPLE_ID=MMETSP1096 /ASSEMBLY_ACC=CAM_ASM_000453 /LENGTH=181 /DNA_ID=CAMNT_0023255419 /DNA_START=249 /DNA_END=794 /DNA_ORIENTATION=-
MKVPWSALLLVDLENMSRLAKLDPGLRRLGLHCHKRGIGLQTYANQQHSLSKHASHHVQTKLRDAVDVRIILDATRHITTEKKGRALIVSKDHFARTFSAVAKEDKMLVEYTTLSDSLPNWWSERLNAPTIEAAVQSEHAVSDEWVDNDELHVHRKPDDWHDELGCTVADWYIEFMGFDPR